MTCVSCQHFNLKADKDMAKGGYGGCAKSNTWQSVSHLKNKCNKFDPAATEIVGKRIKWIKEQK